MCVCGKYVSSLIVHTYTAYISSYYYSITSKICTTHVCRIKIFALQKKIHNTATTGFIQLNVTVSFIIASLSKAQSYYWTWVLAVFNDTREHPRMLTVKGTAEYAS